VLRLGNSAYFRRGEPVESVHEAINRVGLREVNRIVGMTVSGQLFADKIPLYRLDGETLRQNSLATALAMEFLTKTTSEDARLGYTLGLLRTSGRLGLQRIAQTDLANTPSVCPDTNLTAASLPKWEHAHFGVTNVEMSALLLAEWGFDTALCSAVDAHLRPTASTGGRLAALLHVACWTADMLGKGLPGEKEQWHVDDGILDQAGISEDAPHRCVLETRSELNRLSSLVQPATAA
jgi:HD-like signal output (HDOD) protein